MENTKQPPFIWNPLPEEERKTLKKMPVLRTDKEAEDFVDNADLSEYDLSDFKRVSINELLEIERKRHIEKQRKQKVLNMRIPGGLFDAIRQKAAEKDMPYSRYIRMVLEDSLI